MAPRRPERVGQAPTSLSTNARTSAESSPARVMVASSERGAPAHRAVGHPVEGEAADRFRDERNAGAGGDQPDDRQHLGRVLDHPGRIPDRPASRSAGREIRAPGRAETARAARRPAGATAPG